MRLIKRLEKIDLLVVLEFLIFRVATKTMYFLTGQPIIFGSVDHMPIISDHVLS